MQNQNTKINFLVGLFVLGGIIALLFLALQAANLSSFSTSKSYEVTAYFDNIGGLKARAPVRSAGVLVGRVKSISYDNDTFQAKVVISMENQFKFPADTSAKILTAGLIGEQYIGLQPGADDKDLTNGGRIEFTQSAVHLDQPAIGAGNHADSVPGNDADKHYRLDHILHRSEDFRGNVRERRGGICRCGSN